jgi:hypothetical protein
MRHFLGASPQTPWVRFAKVFSGLLHCILGIYVAFSRGKPSDPLSSLCEGIQWASARYLADV